MMNFLRSAIFALAVMMSQSVLAQNPAVTVGEDTGAPNEQVSVSMVWAPGASTYPGLQFDVTFDETRLAFDGCTLNAPYNTYFIKNCNFAPGFTNKIRIGLTVDIALSPVVGGTIGTINFTIADAATLGATPLTITGVVLQGNPTATIDDGQVTVVAGPQPEFSSNPAAAGGTEFVFGPVVQGDALASQNLVITNIGVGTLSGECTEATDAGNVFSVTNGTYSAGAGLNDTVTFACNSAGAPATHTGTMSCTHNGSNVSSPVVYDLSCQINPPPAPTFSSSNPAPGGSITIPSAEQGDEPDPSSTVTILNIGADSTTLTGSCALTGPDPEIYLSGSGSFSVPKGGSSPVTVACDTTTQASYTNTLQCTPDAGASSTDPVDYAVSCQITEPGAAQFNSVPAPGASIDVDGGADVVVGDTPPTSLLTLYNEAEPGDQDLGIECSLAGASAITVDPDISGGGILISPAGSQEVTFSCDTTVPGEFTATYECNFQSGGLLDQVVGDTPPAGATYNLTCEVRAPEAQVEADPVPGTQQSASVDPGGSTSFSFDFKEINEEGEEGMLDSCSVGGGQGFTVNASPTLPAIVGSGATVTVVVDFTDPTGADSWSDTLTCTFSDSDDKATEVTWPLTVSIGGDARFTVLKNFTDDNPGEVTVELDCNTGLILDQDKEITEDGIGVTFVVTDYTPGSLACNVKELPVAGYSAGYDATGSDSAFTDVDDPFDDAGCYWTEIEGGVENFCVITNSPDPVDVVVNKVWLYPGSADASQVSNEFEILLVCEDAEIVDGNEYCGQIFLNGGELPESIIKSSSSCKWLEGYGNASISTEVVPYEWPGGTCYAVEVNVDPSVEVENGCSSLSIVAGGSASCTITNTVFFEGIPTLSEYGMALLALLMLGMGFVAVRRIA